jgi:transcription-repair coupling factor (superfamily II helicase)
VTSIDAVSMPLASPETFYASAHAIKKGQYRDISDIVKSLLISGYERVALVDDEGQFAVRGSVLDIYPMGGEPVRLDMFATR